MVARGTKSGTLYMLHVNFVKDHEIFIAKQPSLSLRHCQLGHMFVCGMKCLSHLDYVLGFNFTEMSVCKHCLYGRQIVLSHKGSTSQKSE